MQEYEARIHRTWCQLLADYGYREAASIALDVEIEFEGMYDMVPVDPAREWNLEPFADPDAWTMKHWLRIILHISPTFYPELSRPSYEHIRDDMERGMNFVLKDRAVPVEFLDDQGFIYRDEYTPGEIEFVYQMGLLEPTEGWQDVVREQILDLKDSNQAVVTKKMFEKNKRKPHKYDEMVFGSDAEVRVAQELVQRGVLFFPLPLGVRQDTGDPWHDHKEPDFLVCMDGIWGILEVDGPVHVGRKSDDSAKDNFWKKSGILCIEHYAAEDCYRDAGEVVDTFLDVLKQYSK